jgi:hypothetical protein
VFIIVAGPRAISKRLSYFCCLHFCCCHVQFLLLFCVCQFVYVRA